MKLLHFPRSFVNTVLIRVSLHYCTKLRVKKNATSMPQNSILIMNKQKYNYLGISIFNIIVNPRQYESESFDTLLNIPFGFAVGGFVEHREVWAAR